MIHELNKPLGNAHDHVILEHKGVKIGIIGLAEQEWMEATPCLEENQYEYEDYVKAARRWCKKLRNEGCQLVIALTHMRTRNDLNLAEKVQDLDLILGGHDHDDEEHNLHDIYILKSGTDFREFSLINITLNCSDELLESSINSKVVNFDKRNIIDRIKVDVTKEFEPHLEMSAIINDYWKEISKELEKYSGYSGVDLDGKFSSIRCKETNISNFVADALRFINRSDIAIINSGSLRTDDIIPKGFLKWKDIDTMLPMQDEVMIIRISGEILLQALENSVSCVPKFDGRFPCISGVRFKYDSRKPSYERIKEVTVNGEPLHFKKLYTVSTKSFLWNGKDGYKCLEGSEVVSDSENTPTLDTCIINFMKLITKGNTYWYSFNKHRVEEALNICNNHTSDYVKTDDDGNPLETMFFKIFPEVDGRIIDISSH